MVTYWMIANVDRNILQTSSKNTTNSKRNHPTTLQHTVALPLDVEEIWAKAA